MHEKTKFVVLMKKIIKILFFCLFLIPGFIQAQQSFSRTRQTGVIGRDVVADAPWRMKKTDAAGNLNGIPVHIFIKDGDAFQCNADLIYLSIYLKNATDTSFGNPIVFNTYSDSAFSSLFSAKSVTDAALDIQPFDASLPVKDSVNTIQFTSDYSWTDATDYVNVNHQFWYFTFTIPPEKLVGLSDIIDIKVYFSLDWETDDILYLRVFRNNEDLPKLPGWQRGDAHYHTMYTNNSAEFGLPLEATKQIAKAVGLDWISSTNHSCDYDNYGTSMQSNWSREDSEIQSLNARDSSLIFIHGMEASVNNSAGKTIHMLSYPNSASPYAMPYLGDGNGDVTATSVTIDGLLDSLTKYGGFSYAAHPFAGGDKLSSLINGGIWNVNDPGFIANGAQIAGHDVVICNDLSYSSDLFSQNSSQKLYKDKLKGGQIWNYRNAMMTTDQKWNPWNVMYDSGIAAFVPYDSANTYYHYNRFLQGLEVSKFLNKKGLMMKNSNNNLLNYRFFMSAGSDAHGDFNYSNTNFVYGLTLDISDAVIGMPSTVVYCPSGKGNAGGNVLSSLENGHVVFSDGPLVSLGLSTDGIDNTNEYIVGDEVLPNGWDYLQAKLRIDLATTSEFGNFNQCQIIIGTSHGEYPLTLTIDTTLHNETLSYNLDSLISQITNDSILDNEYFYVRAELSCIKYYGLESVLRKKAKEIFHCFTNPIWIRKPIIFVSTNDIFQDKNNLTVYPNPFNHFIGITGNLSEEASMNISVFNMLGQRLSNKSYDNFQVGEFTISYNTDFLEPGLYMIEINAGSGRQWFRAVKSAGN